MSDEADSSESSPEPETPKEQVSEIQVTLGEHSKFIADNFDKLYDEIELLKVKKSAHTFVNEVNLAFCATYGGCNSQRALHRIPTPDSESSCKFSPYTSLEHLHYVRYRQN